MTVKCPKCHTENPDTARFCSHCATPLPSAEEIAESHTKTLETPKQELTTGASFANRYQIIEELGKGGMGRVYRALDKELNEEIALKLIKPEIAQHKKSIERFKSEIKLARKVSHKNIGRVHELMEEKGIRFITMEYVPGEDLKSFIRRSGQMAVGTTIRIAKQVCEGLAEAHNLGIVHRDLKPNNIIIDKEGNARIMDFGIARSIMTKGITDKGVMIGTPEYMSPEQVEGKEVDQRSDIYSLGVILFEMVTGQVPFEGDTPFTIGMKHKSEIPVNPREFNQQISDELSETILKCLRKNKDTRFQSAGEVRADLTNIEKAMPTTERNLLEKKPKKEITSKPFQRFLVPAVLFFVAVLAVISFLFFGGILKKEKTEVEALPESEYEKKIVVLPFENLGLPEDEYFAAGMTEEITCRLASASKLGVISRSSAVQYNRAGKMMSQIGEDLGVDYVLEGTVRWDHGAEGKNRVRVTPQLIRAADDTHLWSDSYDRVINDIFAVQSGIAEEVINQLNITLNESEHQAMNTKPTENMEAYQAFLRGTGYLSQPGISEKKFQMAVEMLERAVKLDSKFALAHAELSNVYSRLYHYGYDRTQECISRAKSAIDRALEIQSDLPEAHMHLGDYYYFCHKDYERALEEYAIAEKGMPNNPSILGTKGYIWRRRGKFKKAISSLKKSFELSPQSAQIAFNLAVTFTALQEYKEAENCYNRCIFLAPDHIQAYAIKGMNYWLWEGDLEKARAVLEEIPVKNNPWAVYFQVMQEIMEKKYKDALKKISDYPRELIEIQDIINPKAQLKGFIYQWMNKPELARNSFDSARILLEKEIKERPDDPRLHSSLGTVYAFLNRKEEAVREGKLAVKLYPVSKDAISGPNYVFDLACIYTQVGEESKALDQIEYLLSIPNYHLSVPFLRICPLFDPLRTNPRFKKLLKNE